MSDDDPMRGITDKLRAQVERNKANAERIAANQKELDDAVKAEERRNKSGSN